MKVHKYNTITLESYENNIEKYISWTRSQVSWDSKIWIDKTLSYISKKSKILELWTWNWRDADYIEWLWYDILRSDWVNSFIDYHTKNWKEIIKLDLLNFDIEWEFDLVFANAVLLHFNYEQFIEIIKNIKKILTPNWIFSFSVKEWIWDEITTTKLWNERFFKYWNEQEIQDLLTKLWLEILYMYYASEYKWIQVICRKI